TRDIPNSLFGVEHNGDFALEFDGNGEVRGTIIVEVGCRDRVAAVRVDGVVNGNCGAELPGAIAVKEVRVSKTGRAGHVETSVEIEVGGHTSLRTLAVVTRRYVDSGLAEGAVAF